VFSFNSVCSEICTYFSMASFACFAGCCVSHSYFVCDLVGMVSGKRERVNVGGGGLLALDVEELGLCVFILSTYLILKMGVCIYLCVILTGDFSYFLYTVGF
jgi:hypothetical protein